MSGLQLTHCATPTLGPRKASTYTVLGFLGYVAASVAAAALSLHWEMSLAERLIAMVAPPIAFIVVVTLATALKGREWIVFYQALFGAVVAVIVGHLVAGGRFWRELDVAVLGIGLFLAFGRIGCFHVACCHGRPSTRGVIYGAAHVAAGFWQRWEGRRLFPLQLVEAAGTLLLVGGGLLVSSEPGAAAIVYGTGYSVMRFALELARGDVVRGYARGLSEAQWCCLAALSLCVLAWPVWWTIAALAGTAVWAFTLIVSRRRRELFLPPHLRELDRICLAVFADPRHLRTETSLGVGVSCQPMPDGRLDWILSGSHPAWSVAAAKRIADLLWPSFELIVGRTPGVVHILVAGRAS